MTPEELKGLSDEEFHELVNEFVDITNAPEQALISGLTQVWLPGIAQFIQDPRKPPGNAIIPLVLKESRDLEYLESRMAEATEANQLPADCTFSSWQVRGADRGVIDLFMEMARRTTVRQEEEANETERVIEAAKKNNQTYGG